MCFPFLYRRECLCLFHIQIKLSLTLNYFLLPCVPLGPNQILTQQSTFTVSFLSLPQALLTYKLNSTFKLHWNGSTKGTHVLFDAKSKGLVWVLALNPLWHLVLLTNFAFYIQNNICLFSFWPLPSQPISGLCVLSLAIFPSPCTHSFLVSSKLYPPHSSDSQKSTSRSETALCSRLTRAGARWTVPLAHHPGVSSPNLHQPP